MQAATPLPTIGVDKRNAVALTDMARPHKSSQFSAGKLQAASRNADRALVVAPMPNGIELAVVDADAPDLQCARSRRGAWLWSGRHEADFEVRSVPVPLAPQLLDE